MITKFYSIQKDGRQAQVIAPLKNITTRRSTPDRPLLAQYSVEGRGYLFYIRDSEEAANAITTTRLD